ncbi:SLC13/DASS family transporter [bacterium SCSIO 12741]|nr:SLC13/DASS family transporter [bacterium SCSIO 12741]
MAENYPLYKRIAFFIGPLGMVLITLFTLPDYPDRAAILGVCFWMIIWWMAEVVPIFITALLPMILFPFLELFPIKEALIPYAHPIIFLFLGGFIIALAMEKRQLHYRIAIHLIHFTGTDPKGIILGFMLATALLSMWISNTATAVMMLPIALSVDQLLREQPHKEGGNREFNRFRLALMLGIAYSANIGGMITLVGTPPNMVFAGIAEDYFHQEIGFGQWLLVGIPAGGVLLALAYVLLTRVLIPIRLQEIPGSRELFQQRLKDLGPMRRAEKYVLIIFSLTAICWVFKGQLNLLLGGNVLSNTTIAMAGGVLMFITPVNWKVGEYVLDWKSTEKLPWGILLLFGGGLSLAQAFDKSGLVLELGEWIASHVAADPFWMCLALVTITLFMTELMSNVALVTVLIPVIIGVSESMGLHPYQLTVPVTLAASCAFMMPISTPPNAVVYSSGFIRMPQMAKVGFALNLIGILWLTACGYYLVELVF